MTNRGLYPHKTMYKPSKMVVTKTCSDSVENCSCELEIHVSILADYSSYEYV